MTSPLDQVSFRLGTLDANVNILIQRADKRDEDLREVKALLGSISTKLDPLAEDHTWMRPQVRHYRSIRRRVAWVGSALVAVCSIVGGAITTWFLKHYGA